MNPYLFIGGCPRSGTRLLGRLVNAHPDIAVIHEARFVPGWFKHRRGLTPDGLVTREFVEKLIAFPRFEQFDVEPRQLEEMIGPGETKPYPTFIRELFDLHGEAQGKPHVADKTPRYVRHIPTLHALFPRARFIHLIRDGRDVFLSLTNWKKVERGGLVASAATWEEDRASTAALWWERHVRLGREDGAKLAPDLYLELRYEALVADPAGECQKLCAFLGLPFDEAMLHYHEVADTGSSPQARQPPTPGRRKWSEQMSTADVERFEATAGELLDELSYPRSFPRPSTSALEHASRMRKAFSAEIESRGGRLPEHWYRDSPHDLRTEGMGFELTRDREGP
jgi:Sulfotransferase family